MTDKTATYCQCEADQSAGLHGSCGPSQSGRPLPSSCLLSLTTLPFSPLSLLSSVPCSKPQRDGESAERQEKG